MPTVSSTAQNTYSMYKFVEKATAGESQEVAKKNAPTAEGSAVSASARKREATQEALAAAQTKIAKMRANVDSFNQANGNGNNVVSKLLGTQNTGNSTERMWSNYSAGASASADMSTLMSIKRGIQGLEVSYQSAKKTFNTQVGGSINDLKGSSSVVKNMNYHFGAGDIKTENGKTTYSDSLKSAIKNVKQLVSDYNETADIFASNKGVSSRVKNLAKTFADTVYRADTYKAVGINVDSKTGTLSVNEEKLAKALTETPNRVENALGKNGLAGKAEGHAQFASAQKSRLFPTMESMMSGEMRTAEIYNPRNLVNATRYANAGNILNLSF